MPRIGPFQITLLQSIMQCCGEGDLLKGATRIRLGIAAEIPDVA
jgi:hypothetical protein